jgi:phosphoenolpyruvate carboxykinase (GTP)
MPRVFYVNWFRKDDDGKFMWPGYGENSRVLAWIFGRVNGQSDAIESAIGYLPPVGMRGIDLNGLEVTDETMAKLFEVDAEGWLHQLPQMKAYYAEFGEKLPQALHEQLAGLEQRLSA